MPEAVQELNGPNDQNIHDEQEAPKILNRNDSDMQFTEPMGEIEQAEIDQDEAF